MMIDGTFTISASCQKTCAASLRRISITQSFLVLLSSETERCTIQPTCVRRQAWISKLPPVQPALTGSDGDPPPGLPSPGLENLLNRFRNDRTGRLRSQVHILTILNFDRWNRLDRPFTEFVYFGYLGYWITRLPNLSLVR